MTSCYKVCKTIILFQFLLFYFILDANAQHKVSGKVTSKVDRQPLAGVSISVKGIQKGTITDVHGNYSISVFDNAVLVVSYLGYQTREIKVNGRKNIDIVLSPSVSELDKLVVIGYGTQKKSDLTGSVASIGAEDLQKIPATNVQQSLSGKLPGVRVSLTSGRPGGKPRIRIRGTTSLTGANNPLFVIDGVLIPSGNLPGGTSPMTYVNPGAIESIQVLKDASATAIYGARGANGIIIITTKQGGTQNNGRVTYNSHVSFGTLQHEISTLNSKQFLKVEDISYKNVKKYDPIGWANGDYPSPSSRRTDSRLFDSKGNPLYNTDWQKEATQIAFTNDQHLSFSKGNSKNNFRIDMGYHNENGLLRYSWLKRYSARFTINSQINKWLAIGGFINYNFQNQKRNNGPWVGRQLYESIPISPVKFPNGEWAGNAVYPGMEGGPNLIRVLKEVDRRFKTKTAITNAYAKIKITKGLELKSKFSGVLIDQENNTYEGRNISYISANQDGIASIRNFNNTRWDFETQLTYTATFNKIHHIKALLAASWELNNQFTTHMQTNGFSNDYFKYNNLGAGSNPQPSSSGRSSYAMNSYFGRINYSFKHRYLITITGRTDGSSKFGRNNLYAFFPSTAIGWRISEENFMDNISFISNLKLRASYGITGNSEIGSYQAIGGLGNYTYILNGQLASGIGIGTLANPNLRWERNKQANIGIDLGLLNNRISLTADVYRRISDNSLLSAPVPSSSGYSSVAQNIGSIRNQGIEISLNSANIEGKQLSWNTIFNVTLNRNKVLRLSRGRSSIIRRPTIIKIGEPVNSFYGFVRLGTWSTDKAEEAAKYGKLPGDLRYKDLNNDSQINQDDRVILGNGLPKGYGSLINTLSYKNFILTLDLQFQWGNDILFATITEEDRVGIANSLTTVLNAWTPTHQNTPIAQLRPAGAGYSSAHPDADSHGIHNGSFIRGQNIQLAYNFPLSITRKLHLSNLRIYISSQNFILIENPILKKIIYDPSSTSDKIGVSNFKQGFTAYNGQYPRPIVFTCGVRLSF